jgi:hypothetical protein
MSSLNGLAEDLNCLGRYNVSIGKYLLFIAKKHSCDDISTSHILSIWKLFCNIEENLILCVVVRELTMSIYFLKSCTIPRFHVLGTSLKEKVKSRQLSNKDMLVFDEGYREWWRTLKEASCTVTSTCRQRPWLYVWTSKY